MITGTRLCRLLPKGRKNRPGDQLKNDQWNRPGDQGGGCRYKWEKNSGIFLESEENRRTFALSSEQTTSEWLGKKQ